MKKSRPILCPYHQKFRREKEDVVRIRRTERFQKLRGIRIVVLSLGVSGN
jgi:hypothetical protein